MFYMSSVNPMPPKQCRFSHFGVRGRAGVSLLGLVYLVATADGLTQRAIRRAAGGRESASLYHRAKHLQLALLATALLIYLFLPASVDVRWIGLPLAATLAILTRLQWAYYKKHL